MLHSNHLFPVCSVENYWDCDSEGLHQMVWWVEKELSGWAEKTGFEIPRQACNFQIFIWLLFSSKYFNFSTRALERVVPLIMKPDVETTSLTSFSVWPSAGQMSCAVGLSAKKLTSLWPDLTSWLSMEGRNSSESTILILSRSVHPYYNLSQNIHDKMYLYRSPKKRRKPNWHVSWTLFSTWTQPNLML